MEVFNKRPLVLLGVLCLQLSSVFAHWEKTCTLETQREGPRGICGSRLPEILQLVCRASGGYREKYFRKRGSDENRASRIKALILGKREAYSYLSKRQATYGEQGITCECCYNLCSLRELRQYCKQPRMSIGKRSLLLEGK